MRCDWKFQKFEIENVKKCLIGFSTQVADCCTLDSTFKIGFLYFNLIIQMSNLVIAKSQQLDGGTWGEGGGDEIRLDCLKSTYSKFEIHLTHHQFTINHSIPKGCFHS